MLKIKTVGMSEMRDRNGQTLAVKSLQDFLLAIKKNEWKTQEDLKFRIIDQIGINGSRALAEALKSGACPKGLQITLYSNDIGGTAGIKAIVEALQHSNCPQQIGFRFVNNQIGVEGAKVIAELIKSANRPQDLHIYLVQNKIGAKGTKAITEASIQAQGQQNLIVTIANDKIGKDGAQAIVSALTSDQRPQGIQIKIHDNDVSAEYVDSLVKKVMITKEKVRQYSLSVQVNEKVTEAEAVELLQAAQQQMGNLTQLNVHGLSHDRIDLLVSLLRANPNLQHVDLSHCHLGDQGVREIVIWVTKQAHSLETLNLNGVGMQDVGAMEIANMLTAPNCLSTLMLEYNDISEIGADVLVEGLKINSTLHQLKVPNQVFNTSFIRIFSVASKDSMFVRGLKADATKFFSQQGEEALKDGKYAKARQFFSKALACAPDNNTAERGFNKAQQLCNEEATHENRRRELRMLQQGLQASLDGSEEGLINLLQHQYKRVMEECRQYYANAAKLDGDLLTQRGHHLREQTKLLQLAIQANVNPEEYPELYPLYKAINKKDVKKVVMLVEQGFDPNLADPDGNRALHIAAESKSEKVIDCLIGLGADPNTYNKKRETPSRLLTYGQTKEALSLLSQRLRMQADKEQKSVLYAIRTRPPEQEIDRVFERLEVMIANSSELAIIVEQLRKDGLLSAEKFKNYLYRIEQILLARYGLTKLPDRNSLKELYELHSISLTKQPVKPHLLKRAFDPEEPFSMDDERNLLIEASLSKLPASEEAQEFRDYHESKKHLHDIRVSKLSAACGFKKLPGPKEIERVLRAFLACCDFGKLGSHCFDLQKMYDCYKDIDLILLGDRQHLLYREDRSTLEELMVFCGNIIALMNWYMEDPLRGAKDRNTLGQSEEKLKEKQQFDQAKRVQEYGSKLISLLEDFLEIKDLSPMVLDALHSYYLPAMYEVSKKKIDKSWENIEGKTDNLSIAEAKRLRKETAQLQVEIHTKVKFDTRPCLYPLYQAIQQNEDFKNNKYIQQIKTLIDHGYDPNMEDPDGNTALSFAKKLSKEKAINFLVNNNSSNPSSDQEICQHASTEDKAMLQNQNESPAFDEDNNNKVKTSLIQSQQQAEQDSLLDAIKRGVTLKSTSERVSFKKPIQQPAQPITLFALFNQKIPVISQAEKCNENEVEGEMDEWSKEATNSQDDNLIGEIVKKDDNKNKPETSNSPVNSVEVLQPQLMEQKPELKENQALLQAVWRERLASIRRAYEDQNDAAESDELDTSIRQARKLTA
ncbi:MAG: hypothetical protein EPO11_06485 [Gammaproteobacteria bacterium]|nr:MAG: hypothetical protein EPO11_06485 [Gammaproteobacteria bacterium]